MTDNMNSYVDDIDDLELEIMDDIRDIESDLSSKYPKDKPADEAPKKGKKKTTTPKKEDPEPLPVEMPAPLPAGKKMKKGEIVARITQLAPFVDNYEMKSPSAYNKMRLADLEAELAMIMEMGQNQNMGIGDDEADDGEPGAPRPLNIPRVEKAMFSLNLMIWRVMEVTSVKFEPKIGTSLQGITDDIVENREQMEEIMADIFAEYGEIIGPMMSPLARYGFMMAGLSTNRLLQNKKNVSTPRAPVYGATTRGGDVDDVYDDLDGQ